MKIIRSVAALLCALSLASCTPMRIGASIAPDTVSAMKGSRIATSVVVAKPRLRSISDTLLLVTIKTDASASTLESIWDINPDLTATLTQQFSDRGYTADSIFDPSIDPSIARAYATEVGRQYQQTVPDTKRMDFEPLPPQDYFRKIPEGKAFEAARSRLLEKNYRYLVEFIAQDIQAASRPLGVIDIVAAGYLRIIDLQAREVIYAEMMIPNSRVKASDFSELEVNNLALLKENLHRAVAVAAGSRLDGIY